MKPYRRSPGPAGRQPRKETDMSKTMLTDKWLRLIRRIKSFWNTLIDANATLRNGSRNLPGEFALAPSYAQRKGRRANQGVYERSP